MHCIIQPQFLFLGSKIMYMRYLVSLIIFALFISCSTENPYLIDKNQVGNLTNETLISEIEGILESYEIKGLNPDPKTKYITGDVKVFNEADELVLLIEPTSTNDDAKIKSIRVLSKQYKTKHGLNIDSTFEVIEKNYSISSIQSTISEIIVSLEEIDAFVTIRKTELPSELQFEMEEKVKPTQIPSQAKLKGFWVNFEH